MIDYPGFFILLLLLLSSFTRSDNTSNAVNERIPVNKAEMEAHWKVDCANVGVSLVAIATQASTEHNCGIEAELRHNIQLCAFIYQPPGEKSRHECPDYRGVSRRLEQAIEPTGCARLLESILKEVDCGTPIPHTL